MIDEILISDVTEEEWYESAENEPTEADEMDAEWARELTRQEGDEQC